MKKQTTRPTTPAQIDNERRHFWRVGFDAPVKIIGTDNQYDSTLVDISLNGVLLIRPDTWAGQPGQQYDLEIRLDGDNNLIRMNVGVVHQDEETIGLHSNKLDLESISHLKRLVELNLGDHHLLERELEALG
ncbi:MAG: PilZ domain-containing protein [Gammaproteobacteria bacterium]|nr:PilZ domain-containing protein [Gammaproteobacteria bacterium]